MIRGVIRNIFKITLVVLIIALFWFLQKYYNLIFPNINEKNLEEQAAKYYNGSEILITKLGGGKDEVGYRIGGELRDEYACSRGFVIDSYGNIFVLDNVNGRILKFNQQGSLVQTFTNGVSKNKEFYPPYPKIIKGDSDTIYFTDKGDTVKRIEENGNISTIWQVENATQIKSIWFDQKKNLYIFLKNGEVVLIDKKGEEQKYNLLLPDENYYVLQNVVDKNGNIYQLMSEKDKGNHEIRAVDLSGKVLKNIVCTTFDLSKNRAGFVINSPFGEYLYLSLYLRADPPEEKYSLAIVKLDLECNVINTLRLPIVYPWGTIYITKDEEVYLSRSLILEDGKWGQWIIEKYKFSE